MAKKTYKALKKQFSDMDYTIEVKIDPSSIMYIKKKKTVRKTSAKTKAETAKKPAAKTTAAKKMIK